MELKKQETGRVKTAPPEYTPREFIELVGCPEMGKYAILNLADTWQKVKPDGKIYILGTGDGLKETWEKTSRHIANIYYWCCQDMDTVISILGKMAERLGSGDWLCVESLPRIWEFSQDLGYQAATGMKKAEYLERHVSNRKGVITPHPDQLWQVAKNAYVCGFMNTLVGLECNILAICTLGEEQGPESVTRKETRQALGLNISLDGDPQSLHYPDSVLLMTRETDGIWCSVLKDKGSRRHPSEQVRFRVENWWLDFLSNCG